LGLGPVDPGREVVGQGDARGVARADVVDLDGPGERVAGVDVRAVRRLGDLDVRALDNDGRAIAIGAVVGRADVRGVVDRAAVRLVGDRRDVDAVARARGQAGLRAGQDLGAHRAGDRAARAARDRPERPVDATGQVVGQVR